MTEEELERIESDCNRHADACIAPVTVGYVRSLIALARRGTSQWRDISTAPKDGNPLLLLAARNETYPPLHIIGSWGCETHLFSSAHQCNRHPGADCVFRWMGGMGGRFREPTHWQPLPAPPIEPNGPEIWRYDTMEGEEDGHEPGIDRASVGTNNNSSSSSGVAGLVERLRVYHRPEWETPICRIEQKCIICEAADALERLLAANKALLCEDGTPESRDKSWWAGRNSDDTLARREENEACAKVAESYQWIREGDIAAAIRARMK